MADKTRVVRLTEAQYREMKILIECGSITTYGAGRRHNVLSGLESMGLVHSGSNHSHKNIFRLTDLGKTISIY